MPSVTFSSTLPIVRQELTPPPGATAVIIHATVTAPPVGSNCRLFHLRTLNSVVHPSLPAEGRLPRESEIVELIVRNGALTAGFSGKGGNKTAHPVVHMGGMPQSFPVTITVPFTGKVAVVAAGSLVATSDTDIAPGGQPLELILGIEPQIGADLQPPVGFTISWEEGAVEWPGAVQTPQPPAPPPGPGQIDPQVGPTPPSPLSPTAPLPTFPGEDPRLATALEILRLFGVIKPSPEQIAAVQLLIAARGGK